MNTPLSTELVELVKEYAGCDLSIHEIEAAYPYAKQKLDNLIERFGTDGGKRLNPRYLAQLIEENIRASRFAVMCQIRYELQKEKEQLA